MKKVVLLLASVICLTTAFAQTGSIKISGRVVDDTTQEEIIGANVSVVNDKTGTVSDVFGKFTVTAKELPTTLTISYIGYKTLELDVYEYTEPLTIQLHEERNLLSEVVVVGYGVQKRKELTGSVASVSKVALEQSAISIDGLLGGAISGVNVTQTSGQPGAGSEIRIRGGNSIYASNEPLYVIDGFIYSTEKGATQTGIGGIGSSLNPMASINPSDIESIEVLKDISAKAIYGSRGANGVILVTTKKGAKGKSTIHYGYTIGIDKSAKKLDLLNAEQWTKIHQDYPSIFYNVPFSAPKFGAIMAAQLEATGKPVDSDWQDAVLQTGSTQTHELSISGGDDKTRYLLSGNYTDQKGIILNSGFERYSGRINLDREISSNLTVGVTASADRSTQNALATLSPEDFTGSSNPFKSGISNSLVYALFMPPVIPTHYADAALELNDGLFYNPFELTELRYYEQAANPVTDLEKSIGQTLSTSLLGNFYAKYKIPYVEGLALKYSAGTNVNYITQNFFGPKESVFGINLDTQGRGAVGNRKTVINQSEYLLTYTKQLNPIHYIDLLVGYTKQDTHTDIVLNRTDHLVNFNDLAAVSGNSKAKIKLSNEANQADLHSMLARANYTLLEKYNLTATWRADKSSRFAEGHQWGYFPSVGFSWNVNDEEFAKSWYPVVSSLKFRTTYGTSGNQEIGFTDASGKNTNDNSYNGGAATNYGNAGNDSLTWETTTEYNIGIDIGFLSDRLNLVADVYYKETSDLLVQIEGQFGTASANQFQTVNLGNVTNKGVELALNARLIERRKFTWAASANIAHNVNTITKLGEKSNNLTEGDQDEKIYREGESVGSFYGYVYEGVDPTNGNILLKDIDENGKIEKGSKENLKDRTIIGSIQPDFTYGFSTNLTYRRWDAFVSLQGSQGSEVYNKLRRHLSEGNRLYNLSTDVLSAWTEEKPTNIPRIGSDSDNTSKASPTIVYSRYIEDASFLKIRNITLGYNLPVKINKNTVQLRAFVSAQNLYTFTNYTGYDPEIAGGIDTGVYPTSRTFLAGVGITF
ncbi:SusC/RagA family TonB-linked outer membrane protein [Bacteroidia bacterium]|nr:SusC/RagA family TonB-linked outer membrane protein [Bacteroidia bacterium]